MGLYNNWTWLYWTSDNILIFSTLLISKNVEPVLIFKINVDYERESLVSMLVQY